MQIFDVASRHFTYGACRLRNATGERCLLPRITRMNLMQGKRDNVLLFHVCDQCDVPLFIWKTICVNALRGRHHTGISLPGV